jgi:hypothetical protein
MNNDVVVGYRILEISWGQVKSLFHGTRRSRVIPLDVWHKADIKEVKDGTSGRFYRSGWHFLPTKEEAVSFFDRMFRIKDDRYVVKVYARGNIRTKEHSKKGRSLLADEIMVKLEDVREVLNG